MRNWYLIYKNNELWGRTYSDCKARQYSGRDSFSVTMIRTQKFGEVTEEVYEPWGERNE